MTDTYTEDELKKAMRYIQKKERLISALNTAVRTAEAPIYAEALNELIVLLIQDRLLPDSLDVAKCFAELYPKVNMEKEASDEISG